MTIIDTCRYGKTFITASSSGAYCVVEPSTLAISVGEACSAASGSTICSQTQLQPMLQCAPPPLVSDMSIRSAFHAADAGNRLFSPQSSLPFGVVKPLHKRHMECHLLNRLPGVICTCYY